MGLMGFELEYNAPNEKLVGLSWEIHGSTVLPWDFQRMWDFHGTPGDLHGISVKSAKVRRIVDIVAPAGSR